MNTIDIYDIASSTWYRQSTSGTTPPDRVNPCAIVAAAPDGSSFNVYLYGGQDLVPYGNQTQFSDLWILTVPSFTWIQVDLTGQDNPPARAGHTCNIWDGQIVVVGGYVGTQLACDNPGIYIFNASSLEWVNSFTPASSDDDQESEVLQGSVGYQVPAAIQSVIGGSSNGGATATTPAAGVTAGPFATGKPPTFTVTESGKTIIQTSQPTSTSLPKTTSAATNTRAHTNVGAMVAGVIAGALAILAAYLAFCTWLFRKQLNLYKNHVAMAQRTAFTNPENRNWNPSDSGRPPNKNISKAQALLGPFGTEIGGSGSGSGSGSVGRPSLGGSSGPGTGHAPSPGLLYGNWSREASDEHEHGGEERSVGYGGGIMPIVGTSWRGYGRLSEGDEGYEGTTIGGPRTERIHWGRPGGSTASNSVDDLLGGQEPSFFSVVLNPRRTLKVVNSD